MKTITLLFICCSTLISFGQTPIAYDSNSKYKADPELLEWLKDLNEKGLEITGDSLKIGKEFQKLLNDENYRASIFPETYTWEQTVLFLGSKELKKAFWFFINLYPENETNKEAVLKYVLTYDQMIKMDKVIVNTFNTYSFLDPEISIIKNGKPEIIHPDVLEEKLKNVNEIVAYIIKYREQNSDSEKKQ